MVAFVALAVALAAYALAVGMLVALGRRGDARALAGFIPDCVVLVGRLAADPRVPRRAKLLLALLAGYLALPFDLVPDFIPSPASSTTRSSSRSSCASWCARADGS